MMIHLGELTYSNALPLNVWFSQPSDPPLDRVRAAPRRLHELLRQEKLDLSPISSAAYWLTRESYVLLPDLAISTSGPVRSVTLYARVPLQALSGRTIAVAPASITSVALLQLLLRQHGAEAVHVEQVDEDTLLTFPPRFCAILLIGDAALAARYLRPPAPPWEAHDLGELWWQWTGTPMVFAVWAARRDWAEAHPDKFHWVQQRLHTARAEFLHDPQPVIREAQLRLPLGTDAWREYYGCLDYEFSDRQREGLSLFGRLVTGMDSSLRASS